MSVAAIPVHRPLRLAASFAGLLRPYRYKVFWGGRGGAKSWSVARYLLLRALTSKVRIGCFREFQNSIKDSVHRLLVDQMEELGLSSCFEVTQTSIVCRVTGSEFLFKGLRHNATEIKSTEGIDLAWVEEAQLVSKESWELLIPTIRKDGSEVLVTFNPIEETDDTYQRFVPVCETCTSGTFGGTFASVPLAEEHQREYPDHRMRMPPPRSLVVRVNWNDNPFFPPVLNEERLHMLARDPEAYEHVWTGSTRRLSGSIIFAGKYAVENFVLPGPPVPRLYHGLDFGYAQDPNSLTRSWITGEPPNEELWIDRASYAYRMEINDLPAWIVREVETAKDWPIKADGARPETISYIRRNGALNCSAAEKWPGCVEDRIAHLKGFRQIHVEAGLKEFQQELRLYSWKVDKTTQQVLPQAVDAWNHGPDSLGYALDGLIKARGTAGVWGRL